MASVEKDPTSGRYRIRFRFQGRQFQRSLKTKARAEALGALARVEDTLRMIERGFVQVPADADPGLFATRPQATTPSPTLAELFYGKYFAGRSP